MMNLQEYTDEELVTSAQAGDAEAESVLMNRYKQLVKSKAASYYMAGADRDDVVQEGMIGVLKAIRDYDGSKEASFGTFVNLCIRRQIISAVRGCSRKKHIPLNESLSLNRPVYNDETEDGTLGDTISDECSNDPESIMIRNEYMDNIEKAVEALFSNIERDAWTMYMQGCSYKEIAERMDKTGKTVDNAICRAKKKLAEMLENR